MSSMKKLVAVLLTLALLVPAFSVIAADELYSNPLQMIVENGFDAYEGTENLEGSYTVKDDLTIDMKGFELAGDECVPTFTVAPGVKLTIVNALVNTNGDINTPAIVLGEGAELELVDTIVVGAFAKEAELLSTAIVAGKNAKVVLNNAAVIGGYAIYNDEGATVTVNDSIVLGTVAALADPAAATADADYKMVDIGDYLKDRLNAGQTATKLLDALVCGKAIISIKRLSENVEGKAEGTTVTFTATEIASHFPKLLNYTWIPYNVTALNKTALFTANADGAYTATIEADGEITADFKADVDYKLNVTLSETMINMLEKAPVALDKILEKLDSYDVTAAIVNRVKNAMKPYLETYNGAYGNVEGQLNDAIVQLLDAQKLTDEAQKLVTEAYADVAEAQAKVDAAQAELDAAEKEANDKLADAQLKLDDAKMELKAAKNDVARAEEALATAEQELADFEAAFRNGEISRREYTTKINIYKGNVLRAQDEIDSASAQISDAETKIANAEAELNLKKAEVADKVAVAQKQLDDAQAQLDEATATLDEVSASLTKLERELNAVALLLVELNNDFAAIGKNVDEIIALYNDLDSTDNISLWIVANLPTIQTNLNNVSGLIDSMKANATAIETVNMPAMLAVIADLEALAAKVGITFDYSVDSVSDNLASATSKLNTIDTALTKVMPKINKVLNSRYYDTIADLVNKYDPETKLHTFWAKLVSNGPAVLAEMIENEQYFADKYTVAVDYVTTWANKIVNRYPNLKEDTLAYVEKYFTPANAQRFENLAKNNFGAAIAKYPNAAEYFFNKVEAAAAKYQDLSTEIENLATKVADYATANADRAIEIIGKVVLNYVNPFLHGETIVTLTGDTTILVKAPEVTTETETDPAPETDPDTTEAPETDPAPETTVAPETDPDTTVAPGTDPTPTTQDPGTPDTGDDIPTGDNTAVSLVAAVAAAGVALGALYLTGKKRKQ